MRSVHEGQVLGAMNIARATRWHEALCAARKAAMEGTAGFGILVLIFLAWLAYVAFGGTFALEASPLPEAITAKARVAVMSADAGGTLNKGNVSVSSPQPVDYFPAAYPNRGRDGEGNVMTYEHD